MSDAVIVALFGVVATALGGGGFFTAWLARKAQEKQAEAAARTAEIAAQRQERDEAIQSWKEVAESRAVMLTDARAEIERLKADLTEERATTAALAMQNEKLHGRKR